MLNTEKDGTNIFSNNASDHLLEIDKLELADIVDAQAVQSLMEDFYKLAHIPIGIIDLKGNVLVGVEWQGICTKFHRIHPETCKHCIESDTKLSEGVPKGNLSYINARTTCGT